MRYHWLVPLVAAMANLVIGAIVLRHGVRDRLHRAFAWAALALAGWNLDVFSLYYFPDAATAEWWSRVFRTPMCLAPPALFHLTVLLLGFETRAWSVVVSAGYLAAGLLAAANLQGALVAGLKPHLWGWYIVPTPLYRGLTALICLYAALALACTWRAYRWPRSSRQWVQAKFWLLAGGVLIPLICTNLLPPYGISIYPLGNLGNVFFIGIIAYALVRHRLMDVDYLVRKGVSLAAAAGVVILPGGIALGLLSRALGGQEPALIACAAIALALLAAIFVPTLQQALETRLHRAFFPHLYDYRQRLNDLAAALVHLLDRALLVKRLGDGLTDILDVEACAILIRDEHTDWLEEVYPEPVASETIADEVFRGLERISEPVLGAELVRRNPKLAQFFAARGWEAGIPLRVKARLIGFVGLGQKRDLRIFSAEDLRLLAAVATGASVALENARLSQELRRSEIVLERANRLSSLGMLAAGIAHEIRNPLVAVKTFLDLLPERITDREFVTRFRDLSLGEIRRVTDLIAELLTLGKSTATERRLVDVAATIDTVVRLMESTARKRQVELVTVCRSPALPPVLADPDQLKQITLNLLLNAIEVSPPHTRVTLELGAGPAGVTFEVGDQGPGIPREQMAHIFHPFFTTKETGTGLGLALVHQMVVEHGGEIVVESELGRGSVFRVTLPTETVTLAKTGS